MDPEISSEIHAVEPVRAGTTTSLAAQECAANIGIMTCIFCHIPISTIQEIKWLISVPQKVCPKWHLACEATFRIL